MNRAASVEMAACRSGDPLRGPVLVGLPGETLVRECGGREDPAPVLFVGALVASRQPGSPIGWPCVDSSITVLLGSPMAVLSEPYVTDDELGRFRSPSRPC